GGRARSGPGADRREGADLRGGVWRDRAGGGHCRDGGGAVMEGKPVRVVCFVNQFFGQLGGEDKAGVGPQSMDGAVGAARAVQQALGADGTVGATVACGDNYAAEQPERAVAELVALVAAAKPDLLVAGPAFLAGRYGVACGALCAARPAQLQVP